MVVLEIVSVVYILFVILWAFKLVIDSFDDELLKFYQRRSIKTDTILKVDVVTYNAQIEALEKELDLWWDVTKKMHTYGIEIPPEHRAEFARIFRDIDILLQKKMAARLKQYRKGPRL